MVTLPALAALAVGSIIMIETSYVLAIIEIQIFLSMAHAIAAYTSTNRSTIQVNRFRSRRDGL